jgi:hypothetical protein
LHGHGCNLWEQVTTAIQHQHILHLPLFQVLPPALASRAHAWHNELNVKEGWICWDNIYFEAPGAPGGHLNMQQVGCGGCVCYIYLLFGILKLQVITIGKLPGCCSVLLSQG